jgi:hypothetical protein
VTALSGRGGIEEMKLPLTNRTDLAQHQSERVGRPNLVAIRNVNSRSP